MECRVFGPQYKNVFCIVMNRLTEFQKMLLFLKENIQYSSMELMKRKWHTLFIVKDKMLCCYYYIT